MSQQQKKVDVSAVTPERTAIAAVLRDLKRREVKEDPDIAKEDRVMYELAEMPGWKVLREYLQRRIKNLKSLEGADLAGMDLQEVGLRFLIANLAVSELEKVVAKVEKPARVVREIKEKKVKEQKTRKEVRK